MCDSESTQSQLCNAFLMEPAPDFFVMPHTSSIGMLNLKSLILQASQPIFTSSKQWMVY